MKKNLGNWFIAGFSLQYLYFWGGISIPYLVWRGLSLSRAYNFIALYTLCVVILEYPTGVIGDYWGHKASILAGLLFWIAGLTLLAFGLPTWGYYFAAVLNAFGASLISGSDIALLKSNSNDFKKDLGNYKFFSAFAMFLAITASGTIAKIWFPLPILLSVLGVAISFVIIMILPLKSTRNGSGNIFGVVKQSYNHMRTNAILPLIIIFTGILKGYQGTLKGVGNSLGEVFDIDIALVSAFVGINLLLRAIGMKVSSKIGNKDERVLMLLLVILILIGQLTAHIPFAPLIVMAAISFFLAVLNFQMTYEINELVPDGIRASILSLVGLINRLFGTIYMFMAGYALELLSFGTLMIITAVVIGGVSLTYFIVSQKIKNLSLLLEEK